MNLTARLILVLSFFGLNLNGLSKTPAATQLPGRRIAILVGVSSYKPPTSEDEGGFENLQYAHKDANRLAARLKELGWSQVKVLISSKEPGQQSATKQNIISELRNLESKPEDTVLFYFSGHGLRVDGIDHLAPLDAKYVRNRENPNKPTWTPDKQTLISYEEISREFLKIKASRRALILDACRKVPPSKFSDEPTTLFNQARLGEVVQYSDSGPTSAAILLSCRPGERSFEDDRLDGGVFTTSLLKALGDQTVVNVDGEIIITELSRRVTSFVREWVSSNKESVMNPYSIQVGDEPITLGNLDVQTGFGKFGTLNFNLTPKDATVEINGNKLEGSYFKEELTGSQVKPIAVRVYRFGYETLEREVVLERGRDKVVDVTLRLVQNPIECPWGSPGFKKGDVSTNPKDGLQFVWIPDGNEGKGFWISKYEVPFSCLSQYGKETGIDVSEYSWDRGNPDLDLPAVRVTLDIAKNYTRWSGTSIPIESEWEAAAGPDLYPGTNIFEVLSQNMVSSVKGKGSSQSQTPSKIGSFPSSPTYAGALDMAGNVWELVLDNRDRTAENPRVILKGGGFYNTVSSDFLTKNRRTSSDRPIRRDALGFRPVFRIPTGK